MITSFAQYMFMAPSYVKALNLYAVRDFVPFSYHDISWGTKGDNVVSLGTVSTGKSGEVSVVVPDDKDLKEQRRCASRAADEEAKGGEEGRFWSRTGGLLPECQD
jgi:chitin synthase